MDLSLINPLAAHGNSAPVNVPSASPISPSAYKRYGYKELQAELNLSDADIKKVKSYYRSKLPSEISASDLSSITLSKSLSPTETTAFNSGIRKIKQARADAERYRESNAKKVVLNKFMTNRQLTELLDIGIRKLNKILKAVSEMVVLRGDEGVVTVAELRRKIRLPAHLSNDSVGFIIERAKGKVAEKRRRVDAEKRKREEALLKEKGEKDAKMIPGQSYEDFFKAPGVSSEKKHHGVVKPSTPSTNDNSIGNITTPTQVKRNIAHPPRTPTKRNQRALSTTPTLPPISGPMADWTQQFFGTGH